MPRFSIWYTIIHIQYPLIRCPKLANNRLYVKYTRNEKTTNVDISPKVHKISEIARTHCFWWSPFFNLLLLLNKYKRGFSLLYYLFDISPKDHEISEIARTQCFWCSRSYCYYLEFLREKCWVGVGAKWSYLIFKYLVIAGAAAVVADEGVSPEKVKSRLSAVRTGGFLLPPAFSIRIPTDLLSLSMAHLPASFPFK